MPSNEQIIEGLKNINAYEAKVKYVMKNDKGEEIEETKQWYSADKGVRRRILRSRDFHFFLSDDVCYTLASLNDHYIAGTPFEAHEQDS